MVLACVLGGISFPNSLPTGQIQIGPAFFQSSFSILEDQPMDMLLGLDMLKRHQVSLSIDCVDSS